MIKLSNLLTSSVPDKDYSGNESCTLNLYLRFFGRVRVVHLFSFLCCPIMCLYVLSSVL